MGRSAGWKQGKSQGHNERTRPVGLRSKLNTGELRDRPDEGIGFSGAWHAHKGGSGRRKVVQGQSRGKTCFKTQNLIISAKAVGQATRGNDRWEPGLL